MSRDYASHFLSKQVRTHANITYSTNHNPNDSDQIRLLLDEDGLKDVDVSFG